MKNKITLIDTEVNTAKHIARLRTERSRKASAVNTPFAELNQAELDLDAFGAELAFCKMFNLYPDLTTYSRSRGADCYSNNGKKIDVKQSNHTRCNLIVQKHKELKDADIYCLMQGTMPTFKFIGWAWAHEIIRAMNIKLVGDITNSAYILDRIYLHKGEPGYADH